MPSKFPVNTNVTYKDTEGRGSISVHNVLLTIDEEGFIEAPANVEEDIKPHGFVRMNRPAPQVKSNQKK